MAANMVTDGKAVNMEEQAAAIKEELLSLINAPSAYTPAAGIEALSPSDTELSFGQSQTLAADDASAILQKVLEELSIKNLIT